MAKTTGKSLERFDSVDYKPSLHLEEKDLPELAGWKVGENYTIGLKVKMTSQNEQERTDKKGKTSKEMTAGFEIEEVYTDDKEEESSEESMANKINEYKKQGYSPSQAVTKARKG